MSTPGPVGSSVADAIVQRAQNDSEYRAELECLWPYEHIARQVIRLRMDHGLSQQALADRVGSAKSAISRLESGHHAPTVSTLQKIARAFGGRLVVNFETGTPPTRPSVNADTAAVA